MCTYKEPINVQKIAKQKFLRIANRFQSTEKYKQMKYYNIKH